MDFTIAVLPGDGIGPEVICEAVRVLDAVGARFGHSFEVCSGSIGGHAIDACGTSLPDETLQLCHGADAVLFGASGGPKWDVPDASERPEAGILKLRSGFGLFANIRPAKAYASLYGASSLKPEYLEGVDLIIVRELIGGLYFSRPKKRWRTPRGKRRSVDSLKYSEEEIARVVRVGFELARQRRRRLTSTDKFNVLESSRLWREVATEIGAEYPDVELEHLLADNLAMQSGRTSQSGPLRRDRCRKYLWRPAVRRSFDVVRIPGHAALGKSCRIASVLRAEEKDFWTL